MARSSPVGEQILALYKQEEGKPAKRFTLRQLQDILDHLDPQSVKSALERLRGMDGGTRQLRAVGYATQVGHGGKPQPILVLGTEPDVPKTEEFVEDTSLADIRRLNEKRARHQQRMVQKELDAIDNYM
jgi:hypothetical protein